MKRFYPLITDTGKECTGCRVFKPWSEFAKKKEHKTGYYTRCKDCIRKTRGIKKQVVYLVNDAGRECSRCKQFKPWDEFNNNVCGTRGKQSWCKDCYRDHNGCAKQKEHFINDIGRECARCEIFKPWSEYYKCKSQATGHTPHCIDCHRKETGQKERKRFERNETGRVCSKCEQFKVWSEFDNYKGRNPPYFSECKDCVRKRKGHQKHIPCLIDDYGRECSYCRQYKTWNEFSLRSNNKTGHSCTCKTCHRGMKFKRKYDITVEDYERMRKSQNGHCAICGREEIRVIRGEVQNLMVDHDHNDGKVRQLLCSNCNLGLGNFQDSIETLEKAMLYLKRHK